MDKCRNRIQESEAGYLGTTTLQSTLPQQSERLKEAATLCRIVLQEFKYYVGCIVWPLSISISWKSANDGSAFNQLHKIPQHSSDCSVVSLGELEDKHCSTYRIENPFGVNISLRVVLHSSQDFSNEFSSPSFSLVNTTNQNNANLTICLFVYNVCICQ
jgi:hypothetical protein